MRDEDIINYGVKLDIITEVKEDIAYSPTSLGQYIQNLIYKVKHTEELH